MIVPVHMCVSACVRACVCVCVYIYIYIYIYILPSIASAKVFVVIKHFTLRFLYILSQDYSFDNVCIALDWYTLNQNDCFGNQSVPGGSNRSLSPNARILCSNDQLSTHGALETARERVSVCVLTCWAPDSTRCLVFPVAVGLTFE